MGWGFALFQYKNYGQYMTPYTCMFCKQVHLTSKRANPVASKWFKNNFNKWFGLDILK
jgi:hypothetical protein